MAIMMKAAPSSSAQPARMMAGGQPITHTNVQYTLPQKQVIRQKSLALDLSTVPMTAASLSKSGDDDGKRYFGIQEAPVYYPTHQEFKEPLKYIESIADEGKKYGIVKVVPPEGWQPSFALDTEVSSRERCSWYDRCGRSEKFDSF